MARVYRAERRSCSECGADFEPTQHNQRYCSGRCCWTRNNRERTLAPNVFYDCAICGQSVARYVSPSRQPHVALKFCSRQCKGKALSGAAHPMWQGGLSQDPEHIRERKHQEYLRRIDKVKAASKRYRQLHPEADLAKTKRRNALKRGAGVATLTRAQWDYLKDLHGGHCVYCGRRPARLTQDHVIPLSKGGQHTVENVVPSCLSCNSSKHDGPPKRPVQSALALA